MKPKFPTKNLSELRHKIDIDTTETNYTSKSPLNSKTIRSTRHIQGEGHRIIKSPLSAKNPRSEKLLKLKQSENRPDLPVEIAKGPIDPTYGRVKSTVDKFNTQKNAFHESFMENVSSNTVKNLKLEVETLKKTIDALKSKARRQEESLISQISSLETENYKLKSEFTETVEYFVDICSRNTNNMTHNYIHDEILYKLKMLQDKLSINMETAASFLKTSGVTNPFITDESNSSCLSTGRFPITPDLSSYSEVFTEKSNNFEVISMFDYRPGLKGHLDFQAGERILVTNKIDDDW